MQPICGNVDYENEDNGIVDEPHPSQIKKSNWLKHRLLDNSDNVPESDEEDVSDLEDRDAEMDDDGGKGAVPWPGYLSPESSDDENRGFESTFHLIFSEPNPLNLVSAMKGSREKQGLPPRNLSVSWSPDVYDPPPSMLTYARRTNQTKTKKQDKEKDNFGSKKTGKKGQLGGGNSSRSGGKDRKQQFRRNGRGRFAGRDEDEDDYESRFVKSSYNKTDFWVD